MSPTFDRIIHIRTYLDKKSKTELIELLLDLVQGMDEPTRQRFWEHLAPPGMATADLRYPSPEDFLAELEEFAEKVADGEYFDEEAAAYYGDEDDYYHERDEYDLDDHTGLKALREFFHETNSYFDAGQFDVARQAYEILLSLTLDDTNETLGVPDPWEIIPHTPHDMVNRYFTALQLSQPQAEFFAQALSFLTFHEDATDLERFLELTGNENFPALQAYLEIWADQHLSQAGTLPVPGLALPLRLLLRLYQQAERSDQMLALWIRFRRMYPACYTPLLADRQTAEDWPAVLMYAQEALEIAPSPSHHYYRYDAWERPDALALRGYLAQAYSAMGDTLKAFELYLPALENTFDFETYSYARRLADAVSVEKRQAFVSQIAERLGQQGENQRYLLCQVYLSESRFDEAYALVAYLSGYNGMEESKLVAKAHLLATFGPVVDERMGSNLRDLYAKVEREEKESTRFLHRVLPRMSVPPHSVAIQRAEIIYRRLMQAHIENGRKTYETAAYYCALLGEIAYHEGRLPAFKQWYEEFMVTYKRFRALRADMDFKMSSVLRLR